MLTKEAIIGKRFGLLIVSEFLYKDAGRNVYSCQCDCGSIFTVSQSHLVEKKKFDCGCLSKLDRGTLKSQGRFNNTINFLEELKKKNQQRQELERNYGFELEKKQLRLLQLKKKFQYERSQRMGIVEIPIEIRIKGREERLKRKQLVRLDRQNKKKHRIERFNIKEQNKILVESKLNKFKKEFLNPMNVDKYLNDYSITVSELKKDSVAYQKYKFLMILKKEQMKLEGINPIKVKIKKKLPNPKYLKLMEIQDSLKIFNKSILLINF